MRSNGSTKIKTLAQMEALAAQLKAEGKTVVTTNGCFDIIHAGHVDSLEWASEQGDVLVVGLNSDRSVRENKGDQRPILPEAERARQIAGLGAVDYVFVFDHKSPIEWLKLIKPNVHIKGPGSELSPAFEGEKKEIEAFGGRVLLAPRTFNRSTTSIIDKVLATYT